MDAYTHGYVPQPGDVVWDAGAHAGATAYFLAQMVGPSGKVYAFEPDQNNYNYLLQNIELHKLPSVITSKAANGYHFKTGQRKWPSRTEIVLSCRLLWWQVGFGAPAPRTALEHMAVVQ